MAIRGAHVTVVGGGVGGLTAALLLARVGANIKLLERVQGAVGVGLLLQPTDSRCSTGCPSPWASNAMDTSSPMRC
jgi:glycine/D-amino acid oxidase-like deaminating enzyme